MVRNISVVIRKKPQLKTIKTLPNRTEKKGKLSTSIYDYKNHAITTFNTEGIEGRVGQ